MSEEKDLHVQQGHKPRKDAFKGYTVKEFVDVSNLKIPKNLGTAAVTPRPSNQSIPAENAAAVAEFKK